MSSVSTRSAAAGSVPRERLIEKVTDYLSEHGVGDISLRELASGIGTSHRMLIYHFGSKDGLLVEVARRVEARQQQVLAELLESFDGTPVELARVFWQLLRSPTLAPLERLFFELYGQGLQGRHFAVGFLDGIVGSWIDRSAPGLVALGLSEAEARIEARLGIAIVRGLLLDVLATGEETEVDASYDRYLEYFAQSRSQAPGLD
jgi:AcrR family transcriptional regulator